MDRKIWAVLFLGLVLNVPSSLLANTPPPVLTPVKTYTATARIAVRDTGPGFAGAAPAPHSSAKDPYFLSTQVEILRSKPILDTVARHLSLATKWSVHGESLVSAAIFEALRECVEVFPDADSSLISVIVTRPDQAEAAEIANEIVTIYRESRLELLREKKRIALASFEDALNAQQARVDTAQKEVDALRVALGITTNGFRPMNDGESVALKHYESERDVALSNVTEYETELQVLEHLSVRMLVEGKAEVPVQDELVARLVHDIRALNGWLEIECVQKSEDHPDVKRYRQQKERSEELLDQRLGQLRQRFEMELRFARGQVEKMNEQLAVLRKSASQLMGEKYAPYRIAKAQLDSEQRIYNVLETRLRMETALLEAAPCPVEIIPVAEQDL